MPPKFGVSEELSRRSRGVRRPQQEKMNAVVAQPRHGRERAGGALSSGASARNAAHSDSDDEDVDDDTDRDKSSHSSDSDSGSGSDVGSVEGDAEQAELDRLREGVKDIPFEMVQKLSALGSSRAAEHGENSTRRERGPAHVKRANKNAPQEVSSKIRVGIIPAHAHAAARERRGRDPRFDRLSGKLSEDLFEKSYAWLKDVAQRDAKELRDVASKEKDAEARSDLLLRASQIEQKLKQDARKSEETQLKRARKKAMADIVSSTGQAFWLKKRELRQIEIARKYEALKAKGQGAVDDYGNTISLVYAFLVQFTPTNLDMSLLFTVFAQWPKSASAPRKRTIGSSLAADVQTVDTWLHWYTPCRGNETSPAARTLRTRASKSWSIGFILQPAAPLRAHKTLNKTSCCRQFAAPNCHMMTRTKAHKRITSRRLPQYQAGTRLTTEPRRSASEEKTRCAGAPSRRELVIFLIAREQLCQEESQALRGSCSRSSPPFF